MFIIEVIPLAILPNNVPQLLSYFHDSPLLKGGQVEILIGKRKIMAIVVSSTSLESQKGSLKKSVFQLKKISKVISEEPKISEIQFKLLLWISRYYYSPLGLSLKTIFPNFLLNKKYKIENNILPLGMGAKTTLLISPAKETIKSILSLINNTKGQVLIVVPDKTVLDYFNSQLSPQFETATVHSQQGVKEKFKNWQSTQSGVKLTIGTRQSLFYQFKNLELIIVEDTSNEMYKSDMTPKYFAPKLTEYAAQLYGAKIILISSFLNVEQYYKIKNKTLNLVQGKKASLPEIKIIDTTQELRNDNFNLLSRELKNDIAKTISKNKKVLIFSPRKGYSGLLMCQNCGTSVKCLNCSVPMRVHKSIELILICHRCLHKEPFPKFCSNCNSYKLKTAGPSGTQKIYDEIRELLSYNHSKTPIFVMDTDIVKNETEENEIIDEIKKNGPTVLIATQMIFSHRYNLNFPLIGVINTDSMTTSPDYNTEEKFHYQASQLLDFNPNKIIFQSYSSDEERYKIISSFDYTNFYISELENRKVFNYPPFCKLIKLSSRDIDQKRASIAARILVEKFKMALAQERITDRVAISDASSAFVEKEKGYYIYNIILKTNLDLNPKDILKYVPAGWSIEVDPKSIL